jgi:hypothetical protein
VASHCSLDPDTGIALAQYGKGNVPIETDNLLKVHVLNLYLLTAATSPRTATHPVVRGKSNAKNSCTALRNLPIAQDGGEGVLRDASSNGDDVHPTSASCFISHELPHHAFPKHPKLDSANGQFSQLHPHRYPCSFMDPQLAHPDPCRSLHSNVRKQGMLIIIHGISTRPCSSVQSPEKQGQDAWNRRI